MCNCDERIKEIIAAILSAKDFVEVKRNGREALRDLLNTPGRIVTFAERIFRGVSVERLDMLARLRHQMAMGIDDDRLNSLPDARTERGMMGFYLHVSQRNGSDVITGRYIGSTGRSFFKRLSEYFKALTRPAIQKKLKRFHFGPFGFNTDIHGNHRSENRFFQIFQLRVEKEKVYQGLGRGTREMSLQTKPRFIFV